MVDGVPICWWLPPPCGCSTGFIATPRTEGQLFLLTRYLWYAFPALRRGLSRRPPPAMTPIIARASLETLFLWPEGRINFPRSPGFSSTLHTLVPPGFEKGFV